MILFGFMFLTYLGYRTKDATLFAQGQEALDKNVGAVYTLLLLTSSLLVVLALKGLRAGGPVRTSGLLVGAIACGLAFAVMKALEYHAKVADGINPETSRFFLLYFLLTGIHLLHLVLGLGGLTYLAVLARRAAPLTPRQTSYAEGTASFWHLVDLLWIVLFPLLYLVR
jgi:nitric oxide reductase NorE protein